MIRLTSHTPRAFAALSLVLTAACGREPEVALAAPARALDAPFIAEGLAVTVATAGPGAPTRTFRAPAEVRLDATRRATVVARVEGVVTELFVGPGDTVAEGAPLCALESREVAAARSALLEAEQRADFAQAALAREERLLARDATSEREALDARRATQEADLHVSSAAAALRALGVDPVVTLTDDRPDRPAARAIDGAAASAGAHDSSDTIQTDSSGIARFVIHAPLSGRVLERPVALGEATTAERVLFELADLSQVWVEARLPVATLAELSLDDPVRIVAKGLGLDVPAQLSYVDPRVDAGTQTAVARAVVATAGAGAALRPGLFVELRGLTAARECTITVPKPAIAAADGGRVVFVRVEGGDPRAPTWQARRIEVGREGDEVVEVLAGLRAGETVATSELLQLKSVWLGQGGEE